MQYVDWSYKSIKIPNFHRMKVARQAAANLLQVCHQCHHALIH